MEEDKGGTVYQEQHKYSTVAEPRSSIVSRSYRRSDHHVAGTGGDGIETQATDQSETISGNSDSQSEQCKHNSDDTTKYPVTESQGDFETADDCKGQTPGQSSVCSGHFSSDFEIKSSEDVISAGPASRDVAGSSQSVEKVVDRWQCSDNEEGTDSKEPRPKRSAIRRNSLEGGKRKSVTFVPTVNGEADVEDTMERESAGYVDEKETERLVYLNSNYLKDISNISNTRVHATKRCRGLCLNYLTRFKRRTVVRRLVGNFRFATATNSSTTTLNISY
jgi:hypothetical protein